MVDEGYRWACCHLNSDFSVSPLVMKALHQHVATTTGKYCP